MAERNEEQRRARRRITLSRDQLWPALIIVGLVVVLVINAIFIYIAVSGADAIEPSYTAGER